MEKTAKKRSGMATANTNAQRQSMKNCAVYKDIYYSQFPEERPQTKEAEGQTDENA